MRIPSCCGREAAATLPSSGSQINPIIRRRPERVAIKQRGVGEITGFNSAQSSQQLSLNSGPILCAHADLLLWAAGAQLVCLLTLVPNLWSGALPAACCLSQKLRVYSWKRRVGTCTTDPVCLLFSASSDTIKACGHSKQVHFYTLLPQPLSGLRQWPPGCVPEGIAMIVINTSTV